MLSGISLAASDAQKVGQARAWPADLRGRQPKGGGGGRQPSPGGKRSAQRRQARRRQG